MPAIVKYGLIGALSGALFGLWNFVLLPSLGGGESQVSDIVEMVSNETGPGIVYGIVVGAVLRRPLDFTPVKWLLFVVAAAASYYAAINVAIALYDNRLNDLSTALAGGAAGLVGALLLSTATSLLSPKARAPLFFGLTAIAGTLVGLILPVGINADTETMWIFFFALWQGAYAAASAYATRIA